MNHAVSKLIQLK